MADEKTPLEKFQEAFTGGFSSGLARGRRERLAGQAMQGIAARYGTTLEPEVGAAIALRWADAMMALLDADEKG